MHLGVEIRKGDYNSREDLNEALKGVRSAFPNDRRINWGVERNNKRLNDDGNYLLLLQFR